MTSHTNGKGPVEAQAPEVTRIDQTMETTAAEEVAAVDPVAVLEAEKADLKDKLLRSLAEMENLRRRTEKDLADARAYGVTRFARDLSLIHI